MMGVCDYPNDSFLYFKYYVTVTGVTPENYTIRDDGVHIQTIHSSGVSAKEMSYFSKQRPE